MNISNAQTPGKISISSNEMGFETFSFTLKQGTLNTQQLQVLLEFKMLCRPYHALKNIHNMVILLSESEQFGNMNPKDTESLREILNLFTGLWEAEHLEHEPLDITMLG